MAKGHVQGVDINTRLREAWTEIALKGIEINTRNAKVGQRSFRR